MDQQLTQTFARRFHRRLELINTLCNAGGLVALLGYLLLADALTLREVGEVLVMWLVFSPLVGLLLFPVAWFWLAPTIRIIYRATMGHALTQAEVHRIQRFYFIAPKATGMTSYAAWVISAVAMYVKQGIFIPISPEGNLQLLLGSVLVAGPISVQLTMLMDEAHLRKLAHVLFPDGRLSMAPGRSLSLQMRMAMVYLLAGLTPLLLLAFTAYSRARRIVTSPDPLAALQNLAQVEMLLVATGIALILAVAYITARTMGRPLMRLAQAMRQVQEGDLSAHVRVETNDLLGYLSERFNAMVDTVREREFLRQAFGRYVSEQVADEVLAGRLELGGERRVVSVLFSDIRNFTTLSEHMPPREVVDLLNRYFARMVTSITAQGGMVNKFMGDGLMALFGAPVDQPDHAVSAVRAAKAMVEALDGFNAEQRKLGLPEISIGVGIATGEAVVGNVGSLDRAEYTAIGDTVNTASRIEGLTKLTEQSVLVDEQTYRAVSGHLDFDDQGLWSVKGKTTQVAIYSLRMGAEPASARVPEGV